MCRWPGALWVHGGGAFAVVSECRAAPCDGPEASGHPAFVTVTLWGTQDEAATALRELNSTGCSGCCTGRRGHYLDNLSCVGCAIRDERTITTEDHR
jgi:hypothetical protein